MLPQPDDGLEVVVDCCVHKVVYLVSKVWWDTRAAALDNSSLCQGDSLRRDLTRDQDYVLVTPPVWRQLLHTYSGGPSLPVPIVQGLPDLAVEPFQVQIQLSEVPERQCLLLSLHHTLTQAKVYICTLLDEDPEGCSLEFTEPVEPETPLAALFPGELLLHRTALDETLSTPRTRSTGTCHLGASSPLLRGWEEDEKLPEMVREPVVQLRSDKAVVQERVLTALLLPRLSLRLKPLELIVRDLALLDKDPCVEYEETK